MPDCKDKHKLFEDFLKPEVKEILNNLDNYLIRDRYAGPSICRYCNKRITLSFLPLILWNKHQIHFIEFHVERIIKKEKLEEFVDFIDDFDYIL